MKGICTNLPERCRKAWYREAIYMGSPNAQCPECGAALVPIRFSRLRDRNQKHIILWFVFSCVAALSGVLSVYYYQANLASKARPPVIQEFTYFKKPDILYVEEYEEIKLIVVSAPLAESAIELRFKSLTGVISINRVPIRIGNYVSAVLTAPDLDIKPGTGEHIQKVDRDSELTFSWFVAPLRVGKIPIRLDLFSQSSPGKDAPGIPINVMQEKWVADARGWHWVKYELAEFDPIGKAIVGFCAAIGGALAFLGIKGAIQGWMSKGNAPAKQDGEDG
jgi:hypothetical protein